MKATPVIRALSAYPVEQIVVHIGQHYDFNMSDVPRERVARNHDDVRVFGAEKQEQLPLARPEPGSMQVRKVCNF
jgi:UDP-N-acetylglucosamine 2-epimerase